MTAVPPRLTRRNKPDEALFGCVLKLVVVFILLLFGLVGWSLWGNQISSFITGLSASPPPAATAPAPRSPPLEITIPAPAMPFVVPVPALEAVEPIPALVVPPAPVKSSEYQHEELIQYALELINRDRKANSLSPVTLGINTAAQKHAEEELANRYISHWGRDGLKPYMRYTLAGGENYEAENGAMKGVYWIGSRDLSYAIDPKEMLEEAQEGLMNSPGHRRNILDKWHKKVNLGIAYDTESLYLVQQFEGDYINFSEPPNISGNILSMSGKVSVATIENITLSYDPLPQPLGPEQLGAPPYDNAYGLGENIGKILAPLAPDYFYIDLSPHDVVAIRWDFDSDGFFAIEADVNPILETGNGVYTVVVWVEIEGEFVAISNYSIFIK